MTLFPPLRWHHARSIPACLGACPAMLALPACHPPPAEEAQHSPLHPDCFVYYYLAFGAPLLRVVARRDCG